MIGNKHTVFVIGGGWVGAPLSRSLFLEGHSVAVTTRSEQKQEAFRQAGLVPVFWDCDHHMPGSDRARALQKAGANATHWVLTIPPNKQWNQIENEQWHQDVRDAAMASEIKRLVVFSSTSVYPDKGVVREQDAQASSISPHSGKSLLALEQVFDAAPFDVVILRFGGLIGADRHPGMRASQKGWSNPYRRMNVTTLEDATSACQHVLFSSTMSGAYNVVSPDHPTYLDFGTCLVDLNWPAILGHAKEQLDVKGRTVSSERLMDTGFGFQTSDVLGWAKAMGGMRSPIQIRLNDTKHIHGVLHQANHSEEPKDVMVFAHGYKGFKDWGAWSLVMDALTSERRSVFRFDFTQNGIYPDFPKEILDTQGWSQNTYRKEVDELKAVCSHWQAQGHRVCVVGHSRGGGIAAIAAHEMQLAGAPLLACLFWASVSDFAARFPEGKELDQWQHSDRLEIKNQRTGQVLHHCFSFYEAFQKEASALDIQRSVKLLDCPVFIAHAEDDESVLPSEAEALEHASGVQVNWIESGGHTFGACHPWNQLVLPIALIELARGTRLFLDGLK